MENVFFFLDKKNVFLCYSVEEWIIDESPSETTKMMDRLGKRGLQGLEQG